MARDLTYSVDVPGARLILRSTIPPVRNARKRILDVRAQAGRQGEIELVPFPVGVGAAGVAGLGATRNGHVAAAGALEGDGAGDGVGADLVKGGAGGRVAVATAAAGAVRDAGGLEARDGLGVGEFLGRGGSAAEGDGEEGGEGEL